MIVSQTAMIDFKQLQFGLTLIQIQSTMASSETLLKSGGIFKFSLSVLYWLSEKRRISESMPINPRTSTAEWHGNVSISDLQILTCTGIFLFVIKMEDVMLARRLFIVIFERSIVARLTCTLCFEVPPPGFSIWIWSIINCRIHVVTSRPVLFFQFQPIFPKTLLWLVYDTNLVWVQRCRVQWAGRIWTYSFELPGLFICLQNVEHLLLRNLEIYR